jgi:hypothetical protein
MFTNAKINSRHVVQNLKTRTRSALVALALAGSLGAVAVATPTAASAAVSYGESASFHCARGAGYAAVFFDKLSIPPTEIPPSGAYTVYYEPVVYIYYGGAWQPYTLMRTSSNIASENGLASWHVNSESQAVYDEVQFVAYVPLGYAYRVYAYVSSTNPAYSAAHYDPALIYGSGTGYVCTAAE